METREAYSGGITRCLSWSAGGACLSPFLGVVLWSLVPSGLVVLIAGVLGGVVGLISALVWVVPDGTGGRIFAACYPAAVAWAIVAVEGGYLIALGVIVAWAAFVYALSRSGKNMARERVHDSWRLAAFLTWVVTAFTLPIFGLGLIVLPLAIALTLAGRASAPQKQLDAPAIRN